MCYVRIECLYIYIYHTQPVSCQCKSTTLSPYQLRKISEVRQVVLNTATRKNGIGDQGSATSYHIFGREGSRLICNLFVHLPSAAVLHFVALQRHSGPRNYAEMCARHSDKTCALRKTLKPYCEPLISKRRVSSDLNGGL